jgi:hypothetical protein
MKRSSVKRPSDKAKSADTRKKKVAHRKVQYKKKITMEDLSRQMAHSSVDVNSRDEGAIKWKLLQGKVYHKDYDPDFNESKSRFLIRKVLDINIPLHADANFFDKRYMVAPPKGPS